MASFTFTIEVYSDPICSFCCLGKAVLDRAIARYTAAHPDVDFKVSWLPYMLFPNAQISAYDKVGALFAVYGPRTPEMIAHITALGRRFGVPFSWSGRTGNSRDAHKLILLAAHLDNAAAAAAAARPPPYTSTHLHRTLTHLFARTFHDGQDISSRAFLVRAAVSLGLLASAESARRYLDGAAVGRAVDESAARAKRLGVRAVPTMLVQNKFAVLGLRDDDFLLDVFAAARADTGAPGMGWALADRRFSEAPPLLRWGRGDGEARAAERGVVQGVVEEEVGQAEAGQAKAAQEEGRAEVQQEENEDAGTRQEVEGKDVGGGAGEVEGQDAGGEAAEQAEGRDIQMRAEAGVEADDLEMEDEDDEDDYDDEGGPHAEGSTSIPRDRGRGTGRGRGDAGSRRRGRSGVSGRGGKRGRSGRIERR